MRIGPMELLLILVVIVTQVVAWGLTIAAIVDAARVPTDRDFRAGSKVIWIVVIVFLNWIGALIYFAAGRPKTRN